MVVMSAEDIRQPSHNKTGTARSGMHCFGRGDRRSHVDIAGRLVVTTRGGAGG
jgi:hypothetical protein